MLRRKNKPGHIMVETDAWFLEVYMLYGGGARHKRPCGKAELTHS